ncbi:AI-2E family transporter [Lacticaseibacillus nasuensis]|uniref:Permease n=1 Tax=Lacticaseibacillus nasuensis JCM 17158 TaxID=1291734 RepID=A0A0R1JTG9_9LACO|nr:AI-2E family transporter [Lacticaseibacillus nasuensis]KRK71018.1 permease [Lacticaseibacillus nasuensis JCM 17158]
MHFDKTLVWRYGILAVVVLAVLIYPAAVWHGLLALVGIGLPLILGAAIAYCVNILCRLLERLLCPHTTNKLARGLRRPVAIVASFAIIVLVLAGVLHLVLPQFIDAINNFLTQLPKVLSDLNRWLTHSDQASAIAKQLNALKIDWTSLQGKLTKYVSAGASGVLASTVSIFGNITSGIINLVLALTFAIYLIAGKERIGNRLNRVLDAFVPAKPLAKFRYVVGVTDSVFSSFIAGQVTEAVILGTLCTLGMLLFRFPDALSVGALIGITGLIPMVGAWIGGTIGFVLIAVTNPLQGVLFIIFIIILQQLEGNIVYPRVVGTSIGLPGVAVLAAVTIGSGLGGVLGMLFGVPVAATIYKLIANATHRREAGKAKA